MTNRTTTCAAAAALIALALAQPAAAHPGHGSPSAAPLTVMPHPHGLEAPMRDLGGVALAGGSAVLLLGGGLLLVRRTLRRSVRSAAPRSR